MKPKPSNQFMYYAQICVTCSLHVVFCSKMKFSSLGNI